MPTCTLIPLTFIGAIFVLLLILLLPQSASNFKKSARESRLFTRLKPILLIFLGITVIVISLTYGWLTATPCGKSSVSVTGNENTTYACLIR